MTTNIQPPVLPSSPVLQPPTTTTTTNNLETRASLPKSVFIRLYLSHFLSTWNSRSFEFAAVLFLATSFPGTLLPLSIYALVRCAAAILASPAIGRAIDTRGRLNVVRWSIIGGRLVVTVSAVLFWILDKYSTTKLLTEAAKWGIFAALTVLACVEKPCSVLNLVAVERDWVVVVAADDEDCLRVLNARMRRIDLFCKLVGPLFIALIDGSSTQAAIWTILAFNAVSLPIEYLAIVQVYKAVPELGTPKPNEGQEDEHEKSLLRNPTALISYIYNTFKLYFTHSACLPSLALSVLYLTVLSLGGQMVTFLLASGYTSFTIALVRTLSVLFELSATWLAPRLMRRIDAARAGMWFLSWQLAWISGAVTFFWASTAPPSHTSSFSPLIPASALVAGTILSRVGLWGFDLAAQFLIQETVEQPHRGAFSTTEASLQNGFEMLAYALTIVFAHPDQFRYPALVSVGAVAVAAALFARYLRKRRGHLVHVPQFTCMTQKN